MEDHASKAGKDYLLKILPKVFSIGWVGWRDEENDITYDDKCFTINMRLLQGMHGTRDINGRLFETIQNITFKVRFVASSIKSFHKYGFKHNDYRMLIPENIFESKYQLALICYEVDKWTPLMWSKNKIRPVQSFDSEIALPTLIDIPYLSYNIPYLSYHQRNLVQCKSNCFALKVQNLASCWSSIVAFEGSTRLGCNVDETMIKSFKRFNEEIKNGRGTPQWVKT